MAKRSKECWLEAGLDLLAREGHHALTIDRLCLATTKTKGSFYHHFASTQEFTRELLSFWRKLHTQDLIDLIADKEPTEALASLRQLARKLPYDRERAFRFWASIDSKAAEVVAEVDETRSAYLVDVYSALGHPTEQAQAMAWLEYATSLGFGQLGATVPREQRQMAREHFERNIMQ